VWGTVAGAGRNDDGSWGMAFQGVTNRCTKN
jgi:hypothetical protein